MKEDFDWKWLIINIGFLLSGLFITIAAFLSGSLGSGFLALGFVIFVIVIVNIIKFYGDKD